MPSNQCTNSLMELSFAVGNMFGANVCVKDDYRQLSDILEAWECSKRGKVVEELDVMKGIVNKAIAVRGGAGPKVPPAFCEELWYSHNRLVNTMSIFDEEGLGLGARGPVPPVVKGPGGVAVKRSLNEIREAGWPDQPPAPETETAAEEEEQAARHHRPARGMGYGNEGRKERWYPARA